MKNLALKINILVATLIIIPEIYLFKLDYIAGLIYLIALALAVFNFIYDINKIKNNVKRKRICYTDVLVYLLFIGGITTTIFAIITINKDFFKTSLLFYVVASCFVNLESVYFNDKYAWYGYLKISLKDIKSIDINRKKIEIEYINNTKTYTFLTETQANKIFKQLRFL